MFDLTLTFDNGPEPDVTPFVLDVLKRRGIRSTFFAIGEKLALPGRRALAERAKAEGHWIGNHTWTHSGPLGLRQHAGVAEQEIAETQNEIGPLAHASRFFRPQGGGGSIGPQLLSRDAVDVIQRQRLTCVLWNAIPGDWRDADGWVDRALEQCAAQPWTLMVLHDIPGGAMRHLDRFLAAVAEHNGRIRQDFPPDCVPIVEGTIVRPIDEYLTARSS